MNEKIRLKRNLLLLLASAVVLFANCSGTQPDTSQNPCEVNNSNSNTTANSDSNYQLNANIDKNKIMKNESKAPNYETLAEALKLQLQLDKKKVLKDEDWKGDDWLQVKIGLFYKNDDEFVRDTVCNVTNRVLAANKEWLTKESQLSLRKIVTHKSTCEVAVKEMLSASLDRESILP